MKHLRRIVICLLLGSVINVLVAWGIALAVNPLDGEHWSASGPKDGYHWAVATTSNVGTLMLHSRRDFIGTGITYETPEEILPHWSDFDKPLANYQAESEWIEIRSTVARGWPLFALRYSGDFLKSPTEELINTDKQWGFRWPWGQWKLYPFGNRTKPPLTQDIYLPVRPIWSGFAMNTLFYAALLWLPFVGAGMLRQARRRRRGLCERCGYPRGETDVCSECGHALASRWSGRG